MFLALTNIAAGMVLAASYLETVPKVGTSLVKFSQSLSGFQVSIGGLALVLGLLNLGGGATAIIAILSGLILLANVVPQAPVVGEQLSQFVRFLTPFQVPIGIVAIITGILRLL